VKKEREKNLGSTACRRGAPWGREMDTGGARKRRGRGAIAEARGVAHTKAVENEGGKKESTSGNPLYNFSKSYKMGENGEWGGNF